MNEIMKALYDSGLIYRVEERKYTGIRGDQDVTEVINTLESRLEAILNEECSDAICNSAVGQE